MSSLGLQMSGANSVACVTFLQALKEHGIRVMTIFPSVVDTALARYTFPCWMYLDQKT